MKWLWLLVLFIGVLCIQNHKNNEFEHKVLSKFESKKEVIFRIDEDFSRSYASIQSFSLLETIPLFKNQLWKIHKYINEKKKPESLNKVTVLNTSDDGLIFIGQNNALVMRPINYIKDKLLVLKNLHSNEVLELIPFKKVISQTLDTKLSSVNKNENVFSDEQAKKNGIDLKDLELVLVKAQVPILSKKPLFSNSIKGRIRLIDGFIDAGEMFFMGVLSNQQLDPLELNYIDIQNGGQITFEYMDEMVSGIFSKGADETYIMRVATGKLAGAAFTFAKEDSDLNKKLTKSLDEAKIQQDEMSKMRALASKKVLEGISYDFSN